MRKWEATKNERYAEKWFKDNGFEFKLIKQYVSKTVYEVRKDGLVEKFELLNGVTDIKKYMGQFAYSFGLALRIERAKKELKDRQEG